MWIWEVAAILAFVLLGAGAGRAGARWLSTRHNGVVIPAGWCGLGVGVLWGLWGWVVVAAPSGNVAWAWLAIPPVLAWFAVLLAACDLVAHRLPNVLTSWAGIGLGLLLALLAWEQREVTVLMSALTGALIYAGGYALVSGLAGGFWGRPALGLGDVKLAASLGLVLGSVGIPALILGMLAASVLSLLAGVWLRKRQIPHGPAMLGPAWLATLLPMIGSSGLGSEPCCDG